MTMQPSYYLSHGGGPWPFMDGPMRQAHATLEAALHALPREWGALPKAIVLVSAHWEAERFRVQAAERPSMFYDYGGFPPHTYAVRYPAPGAPALAERIRALALGAGLACELDARRGYDHGAFVPLAVLRPQADLPVLQLSLRADMDPAAHIALGRALAPLRAEGVMVIGSGSSFHNLGVRGPAASDAAQRFDGWLRHTLIDTTPAERAERLLAWEDAPAARTAHPTEEHLLPLMVALGCACDEPATLVHHEPRFMGGVALSSFRFGAPAAID